MSIINSLIDGLDGMKFPDINDTTGKGGLLQGMFMNSIVLTGVHHPDALYDFSDLKLARNSVVLKGKNSSVNAQIFFKFQIMYLNQHIFDGSAKAIIYARSLNITVTNQ